MSSIFISHASVDSDAARQVARRLEVWGYRSLFLDFDPEHGLSAGSDWEAQLYRQLKLSRALVALVSESFVASHWCFAEVTQARSMGKPVFPLRIAPGSTHSLLADVQIVDLTQNQEEGWERLHRGLEAAGLGDDLPFDPERPYPGLSAFDAADAGVFFGREEEQATLLETLERMRRRSEPRLALVLGASGSGKSSLVRAGVLPRLARDPRRWLVVPPWRPGDAAARELARAMAAAFGANGPGWRAVASTLDSDAADNAWVSLADDLREAKGQPDATVLLVIDQVEELFTQAAGGEAAAAAARFRLRLRDAMQAPASPLFVLATLRSDFLGSFQTAPEFRGLPFEDVPLGPLPRARFPRVITGPAARVGLDLEEGLVERLVADTASGDALPLLAFTLRQLWERRRDGRLSVDLYERKLGSIEGGVAAIAEAIMANGIGATEETALRSAFLQLVRLDDEGRPARRSAPWSVLPEPARPVLERFVDERLLVSSAVDGVRQVEVAHEALFRAWRRLAAWLEEARGLLLFRQRLLQARAEWMRVGEADEALLRGPALAEAEHWVADRPDAIGDPERAFVTASVARQQRELDVIRRRRRRVVSGLSAGLVAALALSAFAGLQWHLADEQRQLAEQQRRLAVARLLAAQADGRLDTSGEGLQQSLLLASESLRATWTPEGYAAWARAAALAPRRPDAWLDTEGRAVVALDHHPTQAWLSMVCDDGSVRVADLGSGSTLRTLAFVDRIDPPMVWPGAVVAFSPDGAWLAAAAQRSLSIWDTTTWERSEVVVDASGYFDLAFDGAAEWLAVGGYAHVVRILEVGSWREVFQADRGDTRGARAILFRAGQLIVATRSGLTFWDVRASEPPVRVLDVNLEGDDIHDIAVGDGGSMALLTERSGLRLWSAQAVEQALQGARSGQRDSPDATGRTISARALDESRGSWRAPVPAGHLVAFGGADAHVVTSAVSAKGTRFDQAVRIWDGQRGHELSRIHPGGAAVFSADRRSLAVGGSQPGVWPLPARGTATSLGHASAVESVAFSPDGRWLAAGLEDATLVVRATGSWSQAVALKLAGPVTSVAFTADSRWLVAQGGTRSEATLHVFRADSWEAISPGRHEDDFTVAISPDGRFVKTFTEHLSLRYEGLRRAGRTRLWDISTGREVAWRSHEQEDQTGTAKLSIAEGTLPLGQQGDAALLEQAEGWAPLRPAPESAETMNVARASSDGRWLAGYGGGGAGQGLALLEPATGRRLVMFRPQDVLIPDLDFSPDGRWLASAEGLSVDLWLLGPAEVLIEDACARVARNLTAQEWSTFIGGDARETCKRLRVPAGSGNLGAADTSAH